jgi:deoxycytidylate deaminase
MEDGHCVTTVHAEANAILQAAKNGVSLDGGELYTTASPCWNCFKLIERRHQDDLLRRVLSRERSRRPPRALASS